MALIACWGFGSATAQGLPIAPDDLDLRAVGRVNAAGYRDLRMCSGTLVAPDRVLTAAHCVFRNGQAIAIADLRFAAGYARGEALAHSGVQEVILHDQAFRGGRINPAFDLALLILEEPITEVAPVPVASFDGGGHGLAGYQTTRPHLIGARLDCIATARPAEPAFSDCRVIQGSSGGPALVELEAGWAVWGAISAVSASHTLVSPIGKWDGVLPGE